MRKPTDRLPALDRRQLLKAVAGAALVGGAQRALEVSEALWGRGLWVAAIRPPTVPAGSARLRITFSAAHSERQVELLIAALADVLPRAA
jgi:8-amino-7-oxononanoate synthase